jgi:hypothetical protein
MTENVHYEQLGRFVVAFQDIEWALTDLLVLMAKADDEIIHILVNDLEYSKRVRTADVVFARFVDVRRDPDESIKIQFHELMSNLLKLGERRNELVHSTYARYISDDAVVGLLRQNSKLRSKKGVREVDEEIFGAEHLDQDLQRLKNAQASLEGFRLKIIDWL